IGKLYHRNHARREEALDEIYQILNTFSGDQEDARAHLRAGSFVLARMFRFDVLATFSHSLKIFHLLMNDYVRRHSIQKQDIIASLEQEITNDNENNSVNKSQEEEITIKTPTGDESPSDSISSNTQIKKRRKRHWIGNETEKYKSLSYYFARKSPSPESIYDQQGKRQNTREVRTRRKIEDQRHQFITELIVLNLDYKSPGDYKPQQMKYMDKVMIQQEDHPDVNFVSLIIGPHGNTLKMLEKETNAKIIIRGSVKDGKMGLVKHASLSGEDEPLHAYITGNSPEIVTKVVEK
ncbi:unnamed protein product, partial [Rotaria sp. Silwood1]